MELSCWKIHTEFKNQKTKSVFSYNAVGMAKLFAKFFQNKTYPEELYRFTFSITTNSELVFFFKFNLIKWWRRYRALLVAQLLVIF